MHWNYCSCVFINQSFNTSLHGQYNPLNQNSYSLYSNCDTMILGEIFFRATSQNIKDFAQTHLFSKLDITAYWWKDNSIGGQNNGNFLTYCCIDMTARDFLKIGQLLLNDGKLIKRPFLVYEEKKVILGFNEIEYAKQIT